MPCSSCLHINIYSMGLGFFPRSWELHALALEIKGPSKTAECGQETKPGVPQRQTPHPYVTIKSPAMSGIEQSYTRYSQSPPSDPCHQSSTLIPSDAYKEIDIYTKAEPHAPAHKLQAHTWIQTSLTCIPRLGLHFRFPGLTLHSVMCFELFTFQMCLKRLSIFLS